VSYVQGNLVWFDEFDDVNGDGTIDKSKWSYNNGPNHNNQELQYYTDRAENSRVEDGKLKIIGKCENYAGFDYTSARLTSRRLGDWGPGHRIEVRAKLPIGVGTWPAIWMMPTESKYGGWPRSGEIDIMEAVGCTRGSVYGTVHTEAYNHMKKTQKGQTYITDATEWHTYSIDWDDHKIDFYVDGQRYFTFSAEASDSDKWPFNEKFYLILNLAVGGSWGGFCLERGPSCSNPDQFGNAQVMEVDFVHVYELLRQSSL
jgi:beta-glucanase (GH16 family)